jgi:hypothetical protein
MAFDWSSTEHILIVWLSIGEAQVVMKTYDEAVFSEPVEAFYKRVGGMDPPHDPL